ncbi:hypothetical protein [Lignipirellula cremea]|uniref:Uncharacterized protein n=1 Tax=Lignipirellula cremea TaxID=2528010 RepID=A0A518DR77_9BACT|nr:hypothetical protein [Lignipirellula cremea]QDU94345.1 hypothetical protein Pla8534_21340 [Lignipirellula cremea]
MSGFRRFEDPEKLYQLSISSDWLADTSGRSGARVAFGAPDAVMGFQANVNVVMQHVPPLTQEEFLTLSRLQLKVASRGQWGPPKLYQDRRGLAK